jgi:hypothetical protein
MKKRALTFFSLLVFIVLGGTHYVAADQVTKWNEIASKAAFEARIYAMTHVAIHDELNAIELHYQPYTLKKRAEIGAFPQVAVATAAHVALVDQFNRLIAFGYPSQQAALDAAYADSLAAIPDGLAKDKGVAIGRAAAEAILALRVADGWDTQTVRDYN